MTPEGFYDICWDFFCKEYEEIACFEDLDLSFEVAGCKARLVQKIYPFGYDIVTTEIYVRCGRGRWVGVRKEPATPSRPRFMRWITDPPTEADIVKLRLYT